LLYRLLCVLVRVLARGGGERELEIVVLRHQLAILRRGGKRPQYTTVDRALLAAASRLLPPERWWSCFALGPQTLRSWHRELRQGKRRGHCRRPGRPPLAAETRGLIQRLARENSSWGYMRIQGELLKLGVDVSATTIATVLRRSGLGPAPRRIGPSWSEFLRAQAHSLVGDGLRFGVGDGLDGDAAEPGGPARDAPARQVEADDRRCPAAAAESRLASHRLPVRSHSAPPCVLPRLEVRRVRRYRIDRMLATDPRSRPARPTYPVLRRDVTATAGRAPVGTNHASDSLKTVPGSSSVRRPRNRSTTTTEIDGAKNRAVWRGGLLNVRGGAK
jgi:hypothetical protein